MMSIDDLAGVLLATERRAADLAEEEQAQREALGARFGVDPKFIDLAQLRVPGPSTAAEPEPMPEQPAPTDEELTRRAQAMGVDPKYFIPAWRQQHE